MATVNTYRDFSFASQEAYPVISNIEFLLEPQILETLFDVNPLATDVGDFMKMGLMEKVEGEELIHREKRKIIDAPFINSDTTQANVFGVASVANGDPIAFAGLQYIQLAASAHTPTTGDLANTFSYPRTGDVVEFRQQYFWRVQGKRESVANAHRLYMTKLDATYPDLSSTITLTGTTYGGDQITIPGPAYEEASFGRQDGLLPVFTNYRSYLSIFGDVYETTDKQLTNRTYDIRDPRSGKMIKFWYELGTYDTEVRFMLAWSMAIFCVPKADANAVAYDPVSGSNKTLVTSSGYIPTLELNAPKKQYDDNVTLALFKDLSRQRNRLNQTGDSMMSHGPEIAYRISDMITQLGDNGSIVYGHKDVDLEISRVKIPGANFLTKSLRILDNPQLTNLPGRKYPWYFIIKPMDKTQDYKTGIPKDCFTIMYKEQSGGGSRGWYKVWQDGAYAPVPIGVERVRRTSYAATGGCRIIGATKHILGISSQF